jgi:hypothetical protein
MPDGVLEDWVQVEDYGNYEISTLGRVKNHRTNRLLTLKLRRDNYYYVTLYEKGLKPKDFRVNRLVALGFLKNPSGFPVVLHLNNCKTDNRVENLKWSGHKENARSAISDRLYKNRRFLDQEDINSIKTFYSYGEVTQKDLADYFEVSKMTIFRVLHGKYLAYSTTKV